MSTNKTDLTTPIHAPNTPLFATDYHIYINHTDAGGIVYHANHLVFFENCRRDWFTKLGLNGYFMASDSGQVQHFVVSQAQLNYRKAIFLDEIINVRIDLVEIKPASIIFHQSIHRNVLHDSQLQNLNSSDQPKTTNDTLLSSAKIVIACVQNQPKLETTSIDDPQTVSSMPDNSIALKPIRVPKKLHDSIEQAIAQHTNK